MVQRRVIGSILPIMGTSKRGVVLYRSMYEYACLPDFGYRLSCVFYNCTSQIQNIQHWENNQCNIIPKNRWAQSSLKMLQYIVRIMVVFVDEYDVECVDHNAPPPSTVNNHLSHVRVPDSDLIARVSYNNPPYVCPRIQL